MTSNPLKYDYYDPELDSEPERLAKEICIAGSKVVSENQLYKPFHIPMPVAKQMVVILLNKLGRSYI